MAGGEARGMVGGDPAAHAGQAVADEPGHVVARHSGRQGEVEIEPVVGRVEDALRALEEVVGLLEDLVDVAHIAVERPPDRRHRPHVRFERLQVRGQQGHQRGGWPRTAG